MEIFLKKFKIFNFDEVMLLGPSLKILSVSLHQIFYHQFWLANCGPFTLSTFFRNRLHWLSVSILSGRWNSLGRATASSQ